MVSIVFMCCAEAKAVSALRKKNSIHEHARTLAGTDTSTQTLAYIYPPIVHTPRLLNAGEYKYTKYKKKKKIKKIK